MPSNESYFKILHNNSKNDENNGIFINNDKNVWV